MHPRSPYRHTLDFESLSQEYPALKEYLVGRTVAFRDEAAQRCLTKALLHRDFSLTINLPSDRLCPPVPNRLNYVLWAQDIVRAHTMGVPQLGNETIVAGVDIGTGASAIYPLLACTLEPSWRFVATELDALSFTHAQENIALNGLLNRIYLVKVETAGEGDEMQRKGEEPAFGFDRLFGKISGANEGMGRQSDIATDALTIEFTMCNPPFYSSPTEVVAAKGGWNKQEMPSGACTGAAVEMITSGGEARFVGQMIRESVRERQESSEMGESAPRRRTGRHWKPPAVNTTVSSPPIFPDLLLDPSKVPSSLFSTATCEEQTPELGHTTCLETTRSRRIRSRWYTSMLGKLSSVVEVVEVIRKCKITNYAVTQFVQGQTRRWAIGWSLGAFRMPDVTSRIEHPNSTLQRLMPPRNTLYSPIPESMRILRNYVSIVDALRGVLLSIEDGVVEERGAVQEEPARTSTSGDGGAADKPRLLSEFLVRVKRDSWSRSARRERRGAESGSSQESFPKNDNDKKSVSVFFDSAVLVCVLRLAGLAQRGPGGDRLALEFQWVYGWDRSVFESFVSHVRRRVAGESLGEE